MTDFESTQRTLLNSIVLRPEGTQKTKEFQGCCLFGLTEWGGHHATSCASRDPANSRLQRRNGKQYFVPHSARVLFTGNFDVLYWMSLSQKVNTPTDTSQFQTDILRIYLAEKLIWCILLQIAHALAYCHSCVPAILHRDLKPENSMSRAPEILERLVMCPTNTISVLLTSEISTKLADFGLSSLCRPGSPLSACVGVRRLYWIYEQIKRLIKDRR